MPIIPGLERQKQKYQEFKVIIKYIHGKFKTSLKYVRLGLRKDKRNIVALGCLPEV